MMWPKTAAVLPFFFFFRSCDTESPVFAGVISIDAGEGLPKDNDHDKINCVFERRLFRTPQTVILYSTVLSINSMILIFNRTIWSYTSCFGSLFKTQFFSEQCSISKNMTFTFNNSQ